MSYYMVATSGFGAAPPPAFDPAAVWADWASQDNARTMRAADAIRAGMTYLGQTLTPDQASGEWGPATGQAWKAFLDANGLPASSTWKSPHGYTVYGPTQAGINKMGQLIASGGGKQPSSPAAMYIGVGIAAVALLGALALLGKKKKEPEHRPASATVHAV